MNKEQALDMILNVVVGWFRNHAETDKEYSESITESLKEHIAECRYFCNKNESMPFTDLYSILHILTSLQEDCPHIALGACITWVAVEANTAIIDHAKHNSSPHIAN